ncbi:MAG: hypothetical protein FWB93_06645 [Oscillospiraceae bacterium]|nr:hypothetical protein [Oscillospiraceae bacterium]
MKTTKVLSLLLVTAMLFGTAFFFVGCNDSEQNDYPEENDSDSNDSGYAQSPPAGADTSGSSPLFPNLPSLLPPTLPPTLPPPADDFMREFPVFEGEQIRFLTEHAQHRFAIINDGVTQIDAMTRSIAVDPIDEQNLRVNHAVAARNTRVENALNVEIIDAYRVQNGQLMAYLIPQFLNGVNDYDVIQANNFTSVGIMLGDGAGHFIDINSLSTEESFLRPQNPWWDTDRFEAMTYNSRAFFLTGHLTQSWLAGTWVSFVNSDRWAENSQIIAEITDGKTCIHMIVREGGWHLDFISELSRMVYVSLTPGDQISRNDRVGVVLHASTSLNIVVQALASASGVRYVDIDDYGQWNLLLDSPNSIAFGYANHRLHYNSSALQLSGMNDDYPLGVFAEGNALITFNMLQMMERYLRDMEESVYILPLPMLNAEQMQNQGYIGFMQNSVGLFTIPALARPNIRVITATLELMAELSYQYVTNAFLIDTLSGFIQPGSFLVANEMLNIATNNFNVCQGDVWPNQMNAGMTGPYGFFIRNINRQRNTGVMLAENRAAWQVIIQRHADLVNQATEDSFFQ